MFDKTLFLWYNKYNERGGIKNEKRTAGHGKVYGRGRGRKKN